MTHETEIRHVPIGKLLVSAKFAVPEFQRSYAWTEDDVRALIRDLSEAMDREEEEYFLGAILLMRGNKEGDRLQIVDGQQRLATLTILYAAIRDYFHQHISREIADDLGKAYLFEKDVYTRATSSRIVMGHADDGLFRDYVLPTADTDSRKKTKPPGRNAPDSHRRIHDACRVVADMLASRIKERQESAQATLKAIDDFTNTRAKVISVTVPDDSNAYQIFETLNDRGVELAIADLLKNYLYGRAGEHLAQVRTMWDTAIAKVGAEGGERATLSFIHDFWASRHGLTRVKGLFNAIKAQTRAPAQVVEMVTLLRDSSTNYAALLNSDHSFWADVGESGRTAVSILRAQKMEQCRPLLLACMDCLGERYPKRLERVLCMLVSWSIRFRVTQQLGSAKLEDFYQNAGKIVREEGLSTAAAMLTRFQSDIPSDVEFKERFETLEEPQARRARYYLRTIENQARRVFEDDELHVIEDTERVNLEHILPKKPASEGWPEFTADEAVLFVNYLGNQVLLLASENNSIGNKPFAKKKSVLSGSSLLSTQIAGKEDAWSPGAVRRRQAWLAQMAIKAWPQGG